MTAEDIKLDFEGALIKHLLFKSKLRSFLYGTDTAEAPIRDPEVCALGQWIRERRAGAYAHLADDMTRLDGLHRRLHESANHLMDLRLSDQGDAGIAGLTYVQPMVDQLTQLLTTLQARLQAEAH